MIENNILKKVYKLDPSPINRYFGRPVAMFLFKYFHSLPITANQITITEIIYVAICSFLIAISYPNLILISILLLFAIILDNLDGTFARYKCIQLGKKCSKYGKYMEGLAHVLIPSILFIGLSVNSFIHFGAISLFMGMMILFFIYFIRITRTIKDGIMLGETKTKSKKLVDTQKKNLVIAFINFFNEEGVLFLIILGSAILNITHYLVFFYFAFYLLVAIGKGYMEFTKGFDVYEKSR